MLTYKLSKSTGNGHIYFLQYENGWVRSKIDLSLLFGKDEAEGLFQSFNAVRHGHWSERQSGELYNLPFSVVCCSVCGNPQSTETQYCPCCGANMNVMSAPEYEYCPNCGARMDEESEDERKTY